MIWTHPAVDRRRRVLIIDGFFGSVMAISVMECVLLLRDGWEVCGAGSMGALRASELWSLGMVGIGEVYSMLRLGILSDDADLAAAYYPDLTREITIPLVHVRSLLADVAAAGHDLGCTANDLLDAAAGIHFTVRTIQALSEAWEPCGIPPGTMRALALLARDPGHHPKVRDAILALRSLSAGVWLTFPPDVVAPTEIPRGRP